MASPRRRHAAPRRLHVFLPPRGWSLRCLRAFRGPTPKASPGVISSVDEAFDAFTNYPLLTPHSLSKASPPGAFTRARATPPTRADGVAAQPPGGPVTARSPEKLTPPAHPAPLPPSDPATRRKFRQHLCTALRGDGQPCRGGATRRSGYQFCPRDEIKAGLVTPDEQALWWQKGGERSRHYPVVPKADDPDFSSPRRIRAVASRVAGLVLRGELDERLADRVVALAELARRTFSDDLLQKLEQLEEVLRRSPGPTPIITRALGAPKATR
jgi:hypothetical protein